MNFFLIASTFLLKFILLSNNIDHIFIANFWASKICFQNTEIFRIVLVD